MKMNREKIKKKITGSATAWKPLIGGLKIWWALGVG
jgi:hypothetical protein